jgi:tripartite-type tricarboxylate transporter receptor subunit TctC
MRFALRLLAIASVAFAACTQALAQGSYPSHPVKIVVAFTAGSATDILARVVADHLSKSLGQPFVVENKPGAGGSLGTAYVKEAKPDGYTLVAAGSGPFGVNPAVYKSLPYDPVKDFEPIGNIALTPQAFVVNPGSPYHSLKDLVADAKKRPGEIPYASLGKGSTSHLSMEAFMAAAGIKLNHIPFKGSTEAQSSIVGGEVVLMSDTVPGVLTLVKGGRLRAIGVAIPERSPYLPDVPTVAEQGWPGFQAVGWIGLAAPAHTPVAIVDRLNGELRNMLADPQVKAKLEQLAFTPVGDSRQHFAGFIASEVAKWKKVAKDANVSLD